MGTPFPKPPLTPQKIPDFLQKRNKCSHMDLFSLVTYKCRCVYGCKIYRRKNDFGDYFAYEKLVILGISIHAISVTELTLAQFELE